MTHFQPYMLHIMSWYFCGRDLWLCLAVTCFVCLDIGGSLFSPQVYQTNINVETMIPFLMEHISCNNKEMTDSRVPYLISKKNTHYVNFLRHEWKLPRFGQFVPILPNGQTTLHRQTISISVPLGASPVTKKRLCYVSRFVSTWNVWVNSCLILWTSDHIYILKTT